MKDGHICLFMNNQRHEQPETCTVYIVTPRCRAEPTAESDSESVMPTPSENWASQKGNFLQESLWFFLRYPFFKLKIALDKSSKKFRLFCLHFLRITAFWREQNLF